jgi:hypothetical protein
VLLVVGILFLLRNLNFFDLFDTFRLWPLLLVVLGIALLLKRR